MKKIIKSTSKKTVSQDKPVKKEGVFKRTIKKIAIKINERKQKSIEKKKQNEIELISKKITAIEKKYTREYRNLAEESEKLHAMKITLENKYKELDNKTGLNNLYSQLAKANQKLIKK